METPEIQTLAIICISQRPGSQMFDALDNIYGRKNARFWH